MPDGKLIATLNPYAFLKPRELHTDKLTRSELAAMLENILFRITCTDRSVQWVRENMPDAWRRLTMDKP